MTHDNVFSHNEACPRCRRMGNDTAGDNLGVYSDGHAHCWACGFYRPSNIGARFRLYTPAKPVLIHLPEDSDTIYSDRALSWMLQYSLTKKDLLLNKVLWSEEGVYINLKGEKTQCKDLLIFPFWNDGELLGWIGRYFGRVPGVPKWITRGKMQEIYHILPGKDRKTIILTEDLLSAIKINKVGHESMPVLGIHAKGRFKHLKLLGYTDVVLWLDPDMHKEMIKQSRVGALEGLQMRVVLSSKDPKCHTAEEIQTYLGKS